MSDRKKILLFSVISVILALLLLFAALSAAVGRKRKTEYFESSSPTAPPDTRKIIIDTEDTVPTDTLPRDIEVIPYDELYYKTMTGALDFYFGSYPLNGDKRPHEVRFNEDKIFAFCDLEACGRILQIITQCQRSDAFYIGEETEPGMNFPDAYQIYRHCVNGDFSEYYSFGIPDQENPVYGVFDCFMYSSSDRACYGCSTEILNRISGIFGKYGKVTADYRNADPENAFYPSSVSDDRKGRIRSATALGTSFAVLTPGTDQPEKVFWCPVMLSTADPYWIRIEESGEDLTHPISLTAEDIVRLADYVGDRLHSRVPLEIHFDPFCADTPQGTVLSWFEIMTADTVGGYSLLLQRIIGNCLCMLSSPSAFISPDMPDPLLPAEIMTLGDYFYFLHTGDKFNTEELIARYQGGKATSGEKIPVALISSDITYLYENNFSGRFDDCTKMIMYYDTTASLYSGTE